jgi:dTDP-4-dehydrorhamnose reductase
MKIILFGKNGQVGYELQRTLLSFGQIIALSRNDLDIEDIDSLRELLHDLEPDMIVNASAYTQVDEAENNIELVYKVNFEAVSIMANYIHHNNGLMVHYSTDYVFDGNKLNAYVESDITNPINIYGKSKLAGEQAIINSNCNALIFRTSWVFSKNGNNFIKTILKQAKEKSSLKVISDQYGTPTSAELIADITAIAISAYRTGKISKGIYHLTAKGKTSWHELACHVIKYALVNGMIIKLKPEKIYAITSEEYPLIAKRPMNSCLNTDALCNELGIKLPNWKLHVNRVIDQFTTKGSYL